MYRPECLVYLAFRQKRSAQSHAIAGNSITIPVQNESPNAGAMSDGHPKARERQIRGRMIALCIQARSP